MVSLTDFIKSNRPEKFTPKPYYSQSGDALIFYFKGDPSYGERVDALLTVYRSMENGELVGCEIKGVRSILEKLGGFGVNVASPKVDLRLLFFGYLGHSMLSGHPSASPARDELAEMMRETRARFNTAELVS
jgi:hypothetical protein